MDVDIGCGMLTADLGRKPINLPAFDEACHKVPSGAYKPIDDIIGPIAESVDIIDVMRPIYNFKAE